MGKSYHRYNNYNYQKLQEVSDSLEDSNYKCKTCGHGANVDDHKRNAPSYCTNCGTVKTFERIE